MALHYLLDGYNIIYRVSTFWASSAQKSREKLVKYIQLKKPQGSLKNKVTVVFNGVSKEIDYPLNTSPIEVKFTKGESADEYILQLIKKLGNPKIVVVVSDDRELGEKAQLLGAKLVGVKDFFKSRKEVRRIDKFSLTQEELKEIEEEIKNIRGL